MFQTFKSFKTFKLFNEPIRSDGLNDLNGLNYLNGLHLRPLWSNSFFHSPPYSLLQLSQRILRRLLSSSPSISKNSSNA